MRNPTSRTWAPGIVLLLALAAFVIFVGGLSQYAGIIAPAFFALTLVLTGRPLHKWFVAHRVPTWLSAIVVMVLLYLLLLAIVGGLGFALAQLTLELPKYSSTFTEMYDSTITFIEGFGIDVNQTVRDALGSFDASRIVGIADSLLSSLSSAGSQIVMLLVILFFLTIDTQDVRGRVATLTNARPHLTEALSAFSLSVRKYWFVSTVFGLIVALLDVVALGIIGVPLAWTWGILAFVTNYIPNIGFVIGMVPPALMALLVLGPFHALAVVIAYSVLNFVIQSLIQPKFTGDAVGLNTAMTFISLAFWATVVGPLGALLAIPLTLFFKALFIDSDPNSRWLNAFITNEKPAKKSAPKGPRDVPGVTEVTLDDGVAVPRIEVGSTVTFPSRQRPVNRPGGAAEKKAKPEKNESAEKKSAADETTSDHPPESS